MTMRRLIVVLLAVVLAVGLYVMFVDVTSPTRNLCVYSMPVDPVPGVTFPAEMSPQPSCPPRY
jgi:hypothetical protein